MQFQVPGSAGLPVRAVSHGREDAPTVLVCHGFKGFKDWGMFPWIAETLAEAGFRAIRFDFSHNGVEAKDFDRLDLFLLDTVTRHQEDLAALAERIEGPFALLGHSRGGADALRFAAHEARVACVVTLAAPALPMIPPDAEAVLRERGYYPIPNARTGQTMPMARTAFDDAKQRLVLDEVRSLDRPVLLLHGTNDESVPAGHMNQLWSALANREMHAIEGAGHTFGAVHPFAGPTEDLGKVMQQAIPFLQRHLTS